MSDCYIFSAGFDGFESDPLGGDLSLGVEDFSWATKKVQNLDDTTDCCSFLFFDLIFLFSYWKLPEA